MESIGNTIIGIHEALRASGVQYEVIVVDDGSVDGTFDAASSVAAPDSNVKVIRYANNSGKGHALKHGFGFAQGDLVLFLDADSDLPPAQIPRFLDYLQDGDSDVIIGSKRHPESNIRYPLSRRVLSRAYGVLVACLFGLHATDTQTGIKLFRREVLDRTFPRVKVKRYAFDLEILANAARLGYRVREVPVDLNYRFRSRINPRAVLSIFVDTMAILYRMRVLHYYDQEATE